MRVRFKDGRPVKSVGLWNLLTGWRPVEIGISISEINVDWDNTAERDRFCNYIEHLQKQCKII